MAKNYHIGLDIGTSSVGWAVMDDDFQIMRAKGKKAIGVRLFEEGQTAAERRGFRTTRRRYNRRKWRLKLLEEIFDPYLTQKDETFFARMKESNLSPLDSNKQCKNCNLFFPEKSKQEIRQWTEQYPTIYHLRYALMTKHRQFDIREIFLALHHIVKYRGNFLFNGTFETDNVDLTEVFDDINDAFKIELGEETKYQISRDQYDEIQALLFDADQRKFDKQKALAKLLEFDKTAKPWATAISKALFGYKTKFADLLQVDGDLDKAEFTLDSESADDDLATLSEQVDENRQAILADVKKLYSRIALNEIVPDGMSISESMIKKYETHQKQLKWLKETLKADKDVWKAFNTEYEKYVNGDPKTDPRKKISNEDLKKALLKIKELPDEVKDQIESWYGSEEGLLPKQRTSANGVIPHQLHQNELDGIIDNQAEFYPWLATLNPNENRQSVAKYKLSELVAFRIPYYVGPLVSSAQSNFAWMIRQAGTDNERITPWNFDKVVDRDASAEKFITRMTTKDTYLIGEDVLPANSLLYQKYNVLNELNNIKVNHKRLDPAEKQLMFETVFKEHKSVSAKSFKNGLIAQLGMPNNIEIEGLSDNTKFNSSLSSYVTFKEILGDIVDDNDKQADIEQMIEWSTVFEDGKIFARKLETIGWLTDEQREKIGRLRLRGWGRLSRKLLAGIHDENGQRIIDWLWDTQNNFMQIQSQPAFAKQINELNNQQIRDTSVEAVLDEAYTSPQNKKAIRQVLAVVTDIQKAMHNQAPTSIAIEFARDQEVSRRTQSRKAQIQAIYKQSAKEIVESGLLDELAKQDNHLSDRLYLYFTQNGRDMYTGKPINIDEVSHYDIDHILPQAFIKDDSLDNRVLVSKAVNNGKSDHYLMDDDQIRQQKPMWERLTKAGLISKKKLANLTLEPGKIGKYTMNGFVNRQLVETRQVMKLVANILQDEFAADDTKIITVKAKLNSELRDSLDLYKNRLVNDYHHAMDAYLSVFIGHYLYQRYPKLRSFFVYGEFKKWDDNKTARYLNGRKSVNFLADLFNDELTKIPNEDGEIVGDREAMIDGLKAVYKYKYMLVSRETVKKTGALYNETLYHRGSKNKLIPLKKDKDISIYGGYSGNVDAYLAIVKLPAKGKKLATYKVVGVPARFAPQLDRVKNENPDKYLSFLKEVLTPQFTKDKKNRKTGEITKVVDQFEIILPEVNYRQLVIDDENWFMLGSSTYKYNARQLVLSDYAMKLLSEKGRKDANLSVEELDLQLNEVFDEIISVMNQRFGLYDKNSFRFKINENVNKFYELPIKAKFEGNKKISDGKLDVLESLLSGLHANASFGDLKPLGLKTPFGFMQDSSGIKLISDSILIFQSPTGLFERRVRLGDIKPK